MSATLARASGGFDDVYVARRDGSARRLVAKGVISSTAAGFYPRWSPDRRMFASDGVIDDGSQISVVRASGGDAKQVSHDPGVCCPIWSSDGRELLFVGDGVTIASTDGTNAHHPAGTEYLDVSVVASLKVGRKLLLTSGTGEYVVNSDGTGLRHLVTGRNVDLVLSPDQTKAAFEEHGRVESDPR
jgi:WD40-like Beta Propeller Repeat